MGMSCCAYNCTKRWGSLKKDGSKLSFHQFPFGNLMLLKKWILAVRRKDWHPTKTSVLCGHHFSDDAYRTSTRKYLKKDAVPSIFDFPSHVQKMGRKQTLLFRHPIKKQDIMTEDEASCPVTIPSPLSSDDNFCSELIDSEVLRNQSESTTVTVEAKEKEQNIITEDEASCPVTIPSQLSSDDNFCSESIDSEVLKSQSESTTVEVEAKEKISKAIGGHSCSIGICRNTSVNAKKRGLTVRFFTFPKDCATRRLWVIKCYRQDRINPDTARICSEHFREKDYEDGLRARLMGKTATKLKKTAVPSLLISPLMPQYSRPMTKLDKKKRKKVKNELLAEYEDHESFSQETLLRPRLIGKTVTKLKKTAVPSLLLSPPKLQYSPLKTKQLDKKKRKEVLNELPVECEERESFSQDRPASDVEEEASNLKSQVMLCQEEVSNLKGQLKLYQESAQERITSLEKSNVKLKNTVNLMGKKLKVISKVRQKNYLKIA